MELQTLEEEDAKRLRDIVNQEEVRRFVGIREPMNLEEEKEFIEELKERDDITLAICVDGELVGDITIKEQEEGVGELGILLDPEHHGQGYGTEASKLLIDHAFNQLRYHRIYARTFESNTASQKVWEKLDFTREGEMREHVFKDGEYEDAYIYGILKKEWREG